LFIARTSKICKNEGEIRPKKKVTLTFYVHRRHTAHEVRATAAVHGTIVARNLPAFAPCSGLPPTFCQLNLFQGVVALRALQRGGNRKPPIESLLLAW
jgi:hypothetical protein